MTGVGSGLRPRPRQSETLRALKRRSSSSPTTGHYFNRPDEILYDTAISSDRQLCSMKAPYTAVRRVLACALQIDPTLTPAQANAYFGDTLGREADFYAEWLAARY